MAAKPVTQSVHHVSPAEDRGNVINNVDTDRDQQSGGLRPPLTKNQRPAFENSEYSSICLVKSIG